MQRQYLLGGYLLSLESPARTAGRVQDIDLYDLPADYYKTYAQALESVTPVKIKSLADKYLGADDVTIIVVGEAKAIKAELEKIAPVTVYNLDLKAE